MLIPFRLTQGRFAIVLVALGTLTVQLATAPAAMPPIWPWIETLVLLAAALVMRTLAAELARRIGSRTAQVATLTSFVAWPLLGHIVGGAYGFGLPLEALWLRSFQGLALGLIGEPNTSARRDVLAIGASAFAVVFSASIAPTPSVRPMALAFAGLSTAWLIAQARPASDTRCLMTARHTGWGQGVALAAVIACLAATALVAQPQVMAARSGWLASSGGTNTFDPFARSGVGDGDALVRAEKDASSVGPVSETNVFLATDTPSLYDMFNDMYGDPPKPKRTERAVALPSDLTPRDEQQVATAKQAGREFSAVRQAPARRELRDRDSRAVLHLMGRTPAHLRLAAFDVFDGREWFPAAEPASPPSFVMQNRAGTPWLWLKQHLGPRESPVGEQHSVKILALDTAQLPILAETTHVRIAQVADKDFFTWRQEGIVALEGRDSIPPLTVIDLDSDLATSTSALKTTATIAPRAPLARELSLPRSPYAVRIGILAKEWTTGCDTLEEVLDAVVRRLRDEYVLDRFAAADESTTDVVGDFLFHGKRGPDYLFASSAALLLRSLGYPTRLVSGLYASPTRYERRSRLTPVMPEDVHFWTEVRGGDGRWIPVEPTPGYELLQARKTWSETLFAAGNALAIIILENWLAIAAPLVLVAVTYWQRFRLADLLTEGYWRLSVAARPEQATFRTLRVLDWRSTVAGRKRIGGATPHQWLNELASACPCADDARQAFLQDLAAVLYGPPASESATSVASAVPFEQRKSIYLEVIHAYRGQRMRHVNSPANRSTDTPDAPARPRRTTQSFAEASGRC